MTSFKVAKFDIIILTAIFVVLAYMLSVDMHLWRPGKVVWNFRKSNAVSIVGWPRDPRRHFWFFPRMDFELAMTLPGGQMLSGKMRLAAFYRAGGKLASIKVSGEANTLAYWKPRLHAIMANLHFKKSDLQLLDRFCTQRATQDYYSRDIVFTQRKAVPFFEFEFRDLKDDDPSPATSRQWAPTFSEYWTPGGGGNIGKRLGIEETAARRHLTGPVVWDFRKARTIAQMGLTTKDINPLGSYPEQNFHLTIRLPGGRTFAGVADSAILRAVGEKVQSFIVNGRPAALRIWAPRIGGWIKSLKLPAAAREFAAFVRNIGKPGFRRSITLRDASRYPKIEITLTGLNKRKNGQGLYNGSMEVYWVRNLPSWY